MESLSNKELEALSGGGFLGGAGVWFGAHNRVCCRNQSGALREARVGFLWRHPHRMRLRILSIRNTLEEPS